MQLKQARAALREGYGYAEGDDMSVPNFFERWIRCKLPSPKPSAPVSSI